MDHKKAES